MEFIRPFAKLNKDDAVLAGGKGASLGEMTQVGIAVPPGFVILASTFDHFVEEAGLAAEIQAALDQVNHKEIHTIETASEKIKASILASEMPQDIAEAILKEFQNLDTAFVAVRSSATAEDGADHAWAGQLESYLNITETDLLDKVKHCWASLFTPRAIFYRFEKGLHDTTISVAVVVQKMVASEMSGIAFSVHPVTEDRNQLIIEAGLGLGEAIVSGQITPDSYVVQKQPREILEITVNAQTKALYRGKKGGNEWQELSQEVGSAQVLTKEQILELSSLILDIETHYGFPCDIEWAYEKGKFYIVQSRPITTLGITVVPQEYRKLMNRTMFLLACEVWDIGERINLPIISNNKVHFDALFIHTHGKGIDIYYNWTDEHQDPRAAAQYFNENQEQLEISLRHFYAKCQEVRALSEKKDPRDFATLFKAITDVWPMIALSNSLGSDEDGKNFGTNPLLVSMYQTARKESDGVLHWGVEALLSQITQLLPTEYKEYAEVLLCEEVLSNELPSIDKLKERVKGYIFYQGRVYSGQETDGFYKRESIFIKEEDTALLGDQVSGHVAYAGSVQGKVAVVFERSDIEKVREGDILVTAMTTPNLISAMNLAAAFVTDEGGITCHAAIVARELKKPCIIGTKIATQVLKDGDLVEVDADNGVVKILSRVSDVKTNSEALDMLFDLDLSKTYQRLFQVGGMPYLISDIWSQHYRTLQCLLLFSENSWTSFLPKTVIEKTLEDGLDMLGSSDKFKKYKEDFDNYKSGSLKFFNKLVSKKTITKSDISEFFRFAATLFVFYSKTEFFYTDRAFLESKNNPILKSNLSAMEQIKNSGREYLNKIFFGSDGIYNRILGLLGSQFELSSSDLNAYSRQDILNLFEKKKISAETIQDRLKSYVMQSQGNNVLMYDGDEAVSIISRLMKAVDLSERLIQGITANGGRVSGKATVMLFGYDSFDHLKHKIEAMDEGDILIAETTSPEYITACKKAGAIVTNQGGLLSHAAIVSRELGIPCIVGTGNATDVIKNGDMIEVDGDKSTIRILRRAQR